MVKLSSVRFHWRASGPLVLDVPAFEVAKGERIFLCGPSGSGKTTLLNLLGGVAVPEDGEIRIMNIDIAALTNTARDRFRADHIGFIFQMFNLVPYLSMIENVTLPCRFSVQRREQALAMSETLEDEAIRLLTHMRLDIGSLSERPVAELSVGQQQRVAAARSLIGGPELVIADEPTSSVDDEATQSFLDLLFAEVARVGATLVFVSHEVRLGELFDRTVELSEINRAAVRA